MLGASGQLGRALATLLRDRADYDFATREQLDITDASALAAFDLSEYSAIINAAAYTRVDEAETPAGRQLAWDTNVTALGRLAARCRAADITLVHVSSDYVFDGTNPSYTEDSPLCPLGVYGQTKAAGEALVAQLEKHYLLRTSWVVGAGKNFVATMARLAAANVNPTVVNDQVGRLTFAQDLAAGIVHLLDTAAPFGTYNLSNDGVPDSWAGIATKIFTLLGHDPARVSGISTAAYQAPHATAAPRPANSTLELSLIKAVGFTPANQFERLSGYLAEL